MSTQRKHLVAVGTAVAIAFVTKTIVASSFDNLDFEASVFPPNAGMSVSQPTGLLFPNWTVRFGNLVQTAGGLNEIQLAGPAVMLKTSTATFMEGNKALYLGAWFTTDASIAQVGDVPSDVRSVTFMARNTSDASDHLMPGPLALLMNLQSVPLVPLSSNNGDVLYGADISVWAGTTAELRIDVTGYGVPGYSGYSFLDAIAFSSSPLPEPRTSAVSVLACAPIMLRRRPRSCAELAVSGTFPISRT